MGGHIFGDGVYQKIIAKQYCRMEEISIEETNILRAKIGLAPIEVPNQTINNSKKELSIDETNKLRISLGLKPIEAVKPVAKEIDVKNLQDFEADKLKQRKDDELKNRLQVIRDNNERKRKINGKKLLDDYQETNTDEWLDSLKIKRPKQKPLAQTIENDREELLLQGEISHSMKELEGIKDHEIFTLNDNDILDENDQLINDRLQAQAKVERDLKEKSKIRDIKGGHYHKIEEEQTEEVVKLDGTEIKLGVKDDLDTAIVPGKKKIDYDLFDELDEPKLKKPIKMKKMKKKDKNIRIKNDNDDEELKIESVKLQPIFDEEDDFEKTLNLQRKLKQKSRQFMKPEEIAKEIRQYERIKQEELVDTMIEGNEGLVFNQTDEFLNNLKPKEVKKEVEELTDEKIKQESTDKHDKIESSSVKDDIIQVSSAVEENPVKETTPTIGVGLGLTLKYLKTNKLIEKTPESINSQNEIIKRAQNLHHKMKQQEEMVKKALENDEVYNHLSPNEQEDYFRDKLDEYLQSHNESSMSMDFISNYKPNVKLTYTDRKGNVLNTKDAFKQLSSDYHGTKSQDKSKKHQKKKVRK